jgi:DNA-binding SARP family transcriptional activator
LAGETRIQICGRVVVTLDGQRVERDLPGRQGRLLFVYLAVNRLRAASREELVQALWPEGEPEKADSALASLLSKLRRVVAPARLEGRGEVRLVLPSGAWVDLEAASEALHRAEAAVATGDNAAAWGPARVTQHVGARGFLPGEAAPWAAEVRNRLEGMYLRSLELVAEACLAIGGTELDTAERAARSLVQAVPYRESGYRYLMRVLERRGNSAEALTVYDGLRVLLREELGTSPSPATQGLYRELLG